MCGEETEWEEQEVIHNRRCYVEGMGQLCGHCYTDTFPYKTPEDIAGQALSDMQLYDVFKNPWDEDC